MQESTNTTKRTILYYPTIGIPNTAWIKQAILYWDEIGSIVPQIGNESLIELTPEMEYLKSEGVFRPFNPEILIKHNDGWHVLKKFEQEFKDLVKLDVFQRLIGTTKKLMSPIHHDKVSYELFYESLLPEGLAKDNQVDPDWFLFEEKTALLYMSLLAKYLSDISVQTTIPGTDHVGYENLIFKTTETHDGMLCLDSRFNNILPIPSEDVSLDDILYFKYKRRNELLNFRELLDELQTALSQANELRQINSIVVNFKEKIEKGISDLNALLKDGSISSTIGSFKTIITIKSPTLIGTVGVLSGYATKLTTLPIELIAAGLLVTGTIEVTKHLIDKRNEKRAMLRDSAFAYLYHANKECLV